jgi:hypothetical protein
MSSLARSLTGAAALLAAAVGAFVGCAADKAEAPPPARLSTEALQDPQSCAGCHPDHVREWSGSMHAYSGFDPVFLAMNRRMQRETNGAAGAFCIQCHAPLAFRLGLSKDGLNLEQLEPKLRSVNCYFCHDSEFHGGPLNNNPLALLNDGVMRGGFHDPVPTTAHESSYASNVDHIDESSSIACGSCHDIVNPLGTHLERTFSEWKQSHLALETETNCGACHMEERKGLAAQAPGALVRKVHDHSLPGVDLALTPFPEMDAQRRGVDKLLGDALSARLCVKPGRAGVIVEVTLVNATVGHGMPSGSAQDRRVWVELEGRLGGAVAFGSGQIPDRKAVASAADPQLFLARDVDYDADNKETKLFWRPTRFESVQIPVAASSSAPESARSLARTYTFPGPMPDAVSMRVHVRPIDFDLIDELVGSGDLDPAVADKIPTYTLPSTNLTWAPGADCVATPGL